MKNTQYNSFLWPNHQNFRILKEIVVEEHDHNVRFYTGSGNTDVLRMRKCNYSFFAMHNEKSATLPLFMAESPKISVS